MKGLASAFACGLVFGAGLLLAGMTDPQNIIGFLDVAGSWQPALALVMAGAIGVHATALYLWRPRSSSALLSSLPPPSLIDRPLLVGAALFGIGWGLAGYCPGPAIVSVGAGSSAAALFGAAMLVGMFAVDVLRVRISGSPAARALTEPLAHVGSHG